MPSIARSLSRRRGSLCDQVTSERDEYLDTAERILNHIRADELDPALAALVAETFALVGNFSRAEVADASCALCFALLSSFCGLLC